MIRWIVSCALLAVAGMSGDFARAADTSRSHAHDLAIIDAGGDVAKDSRAVQRFEVLLAYLSRACDVSEQEIADATVAMKDILRDKHGCRVSNLDLLKNVFVALKDHPPGTMGFKDALAAVALLICMDPESK